MLVLAFVWFCGFENLALSSTRVCMTIPLVCLNQNWVPLIWDSQFEEVDST
jgi:hypothetical protein